MAKTKILTPIHLACSTDEMRPAMNCVYIKNGWAVATNGHMLIAQELESCCTGTIGDKVFNFLDGQLIPRKIWAELMNNYRMFALGTRQIADREGNAIPLSILRCWRHDCDLVVEYTREQLSIDKDERFPDFISVLNPQKLEFGPQLVSSYDARYINIINQVFVGHNRRLIFINNKAQNRGTYVLGGNGTGVEKQIALLMPIQYSGVYGEVDPKFGSPEIIFDNLKEQYFDHFKS